MGVALTIGLLDFLALGLAYAGRSVLEQWARRSVRDVRREFHSRSPRWEALMDELRSLLRGRGARLIGDDRSSAQILERALVMLTLRRVVVVEGDGFRVDHGQDRLLRYYANSIAHFFGDGVPRLDRTAGGE